MTSEHSNGVIDVDVVGSTCDAGGQSWQVQASQESHHCILPVRTYVEEVFIEALKQMNPNKDLIRLSIGELCMDYNSCATSDQ